jgi:Zn-dependent protease with chaperone function
VRRYAFVAQVLGLLAGFYLICAALVAGLTTLTIVGFAEVGANRLTVFLLVVTLAAAFVVIRGVFVSTHLRTRDIVGVEVTAADQPALWARVHQLAAQVGTRPPRRIFLVPEVNAAVWENTRLLGLIPGKRQMMVGVPLLMALTPAQLDAVLAHELGHYGNRDTRLGGLVGRTRQGVLGALRAAASPRKFTLPGAMLFVAVFKWYAQVVLRVTQEASRAQEYAADRVAAAISGKVNAIAALGEVQVVDTAFDFYLDRYVSRGLDIGLLPPPPEVFGGFIGLLAEPSRQTELDELRREPRAEKADAFDSHPPTPERIAALRRLPDDGIPLDQSGLKAVAILANPQDALAKVAMRALRKLSAGKEAVTWDTLADAIGRRRADERARPLQEVVARLSGQPAHMTTFVNLVEAGRLNEVLDALPRTVAAQKTNATGRVAREYAKTELGAMLAGWISGDFARVGQARWTHSWADIDGELQIAADVRAGIEEAVDALIAVRPDGSRLRALVLGPVSP